MWIIILILIGIGMLDRLVNESIENYDFRVKKVTLSNKKIREDIEQSVDKYLKESNDSKRKKAVKKQLALEKKIWKKREAEVKIIPIRSQHNKRC